MIDFAYMTQSGCVFCFFSVKRERSSEEERDLAKSSPKRNGAGVFRFSHYIPEQYKSGKGAAYDATSSLDGGRRH